MPRYSFPRWSNKVVPILLFGVFGPLATASTAGIWYYGTNKHVEVGYTPVQPVEYSHKLHAGDLGIDCRYCHYTAEKSGFAAVPPTQVCMNCHTKVRTDSTKLLPVRESAASDQPIPWVKVHNLPNFVYFDHSAHLAAGVGCSSCHGRVDQMARISQTQPLSMGWCLDCHRNPGPALRKHTELTDMNWKPKPESELSGQIHQAMTESGREVHPPVHCSGCHR